MKPNCSLSDEERKEREARSVALEKAYVHDVYDQLSGRFSDERYRPWPKIRQFLERLEPGSLVCDAGCGNGKYLAINSSLFKVGSDRCSSLAEAARKKGHEVLVCDTLALPFRDESFDAALSIAVIHHLATRDRRVRALREVARVLRVGGRLLITVWAKEQRHRKFESQDILVPWSTPDRSSSEDKPSSQDPDFTSTTTSDDDITHYHAYTQTSDSDSCYSCSRNRLQARGDETSSRCEKCMVHAEAADGFTRRKLRSRHKGRSVDPRCPSCSSQSSSDLSSPGETCYSFVRKALQKLASSRRGPGSHAKRWFTMDQHGTKPHIERGLNTLRQASRVAEATVECPIELRLLDPEEDAANTGKLIAISEPSEERSRSSPPSLGGKRDSNISGDAPIFPRPVSTSSLISVVRNARSRSLSDLLHILPASVSSWFRNRKCSDECPRDPNQSVLSKSQSSASWLIPGYFSSALVINQDEKNPAQVVEDGQSGFAQKAEINETVRRRQMLVKQKRTASSYDEDFSKEAMNFSLDTFGLNKKVFKQGSLNDNWFSHERILQREQLKQSIRKQTSLADDRVLTASIPELSEDQAIDQSTSGSFQRLLDNVDIPTDFTSLTNSLMRMWQAWRRDSNSYSSTEVQNPVSVSTPKADSLISNTEAQLSKEQNPEGSPKSVAEGSQRSPLRGNDKDSEFNFALSKCCAEQDLTYSPRVVSQRQSYREEGSDSSKDSSLQSDTSIDSEDSCISVIFVPRPDAKNQLGDELNKEKTRTSSSSSSEGSERSPKMKHFPPTPISELPETETSQNISPPLKESVKPVTEVQQTTDAPPAVTADLPELPRAPPISKTVEASRNPPLVGTKADDDDSIEVIRKSGASGAQLYKRSVPRFLSFEVFNPETDDVDSDSSSSDSSSDTAGSVISVGGDPMWPAFQDRRPTILTPSIADLIQRDKQPKSDKDKDSNSSLSRCSSVSAEMKEKDTSSAELVNFFTTSREDRPSLMSRSSLEMLGEEEENEQIDKFENSDQVTDCLGSLAKDKTKRSFSASTSSLDSSFSAPSLSSARHSSSASVLSEVRKNSDDSALLPAMALLKPRVGPAPSVRRMASKASSVSEDELRSSYCTCPKFPLAQLLDRTGEKSLSVSTSQDSLPSDTGGALSLHRYYHVFREGELDQLIERYVENLHIISSYYDHANWCIVAEKVHVWTI